MQIDREWLKGTVGYVAKKCWNCKSLSFVAIFIFEIWKIGLMLLVKDTSWCFNEKRTPARRSNMKLVVLVSNVSSCYTVRIIAKKNKGKVLSNGFWKPQSHKKFAKKCHFFATGYYINWQNVIFLKIWAWDYFFLICTFF